MSSIVVFLGLLASPAHADSPPSWPEGASIQVGTNQLLYDEPARTEEELRRREGRYGVALWLPEAEDDGKVVQYRVLQDGMLVGAVRADGDRRLWEAEVQGTVRWAVVPVDDAGQQGPALETTSEYLDPFALASGGARIGSLTGGSLTGDELGGMSGLFSEGSVGGAPSNGGSRSLGEKASAGPGVVVRVSSVDGGLGEAEVKRVVARSRAQVRYCVERARQKEALSSGVIALGFEVSEAGVVQGVELRRDTVGGSSAASCVQSRPSRWRFPSAGTTSMVELEIEVTLDD